MDVYQARNELRKMAKRHLLSLVSNQRISGCLIGSRACGLCLHYKGFNFCVSEIMGQGCQVEKSAKSEGVYQCQVECTSPLPLMDRFGINPLPPGKKAVEFKVYYRDQVARSITLLGTVIERRTTERGNNLKDLWVKAVKDYSDCVADPSTIFVLSP